MSGTALQSGAMEFPASSSGTSQHSSNVQSGVTRKRSPSKTQLNYNPINTTSLSVLNSPPPQIYQHEHQLTHQQYQLQLHSQQAQQAQAQQLQAQQLQAQQLQAQQLQAQSQAQPASQSHRKPDARKQTNRNSSSPSPSPPSLQSHVHVVKLASFERPNEFLKILAVPELPESLKIGRQNMPKATNKITDGFFDSRVLSRNHAELFIRENRLYIKDLKSSNGTFINDEKLEPFKDYELKVGDKLDLGTTLESQVAHKKITCTISEFNYVSLQDYQSFVGKVLQKDDLAAKRLELFNSTVDALIFGELVDERQEDDSLMALLGGDEEKGGDNEESTPALSTKNHPEPSSFISGLNIKPSSSMQDIIRKLALAVNNEFVQQQRLKQVSLFLKGYNSLTPTNAPEMARSYRDLVKRKSEPRSLSSGSIESGSLGKIQSLETELSVLRRQVSGARQDSAESRRIAEECESLKMLVRDKERESEKMRKELARNQRQISDYENQMSRQAEDIKELIGNQADLKEKLKVSSQKLSASLIRVSGYERQLNDSKEARKDLSSRIEALQKAQSIRLVDESIEVAPPMQDTRSGNPLLLVSLGVLFLAVASVYYGVQLSY
ncbi:DEKNAAC105428 [Brettanomyces naardenensis]|uniref:DEKNAAC105428 n=1 Tax=Brettanomyces naardenensis TaxID=13370 RepID=A0A448YT85_BRENA|nr:DEKNAAC105428 [Brettanomyces naardenensis]